jgi:hypothetical protein
MRIWLPYSTSFLSVPGSSPSSLLNPRQTNSARASASSRPTSETTSNSFRTSGNAAVRAKRSVQRLSNRRLIRSSASGSPKSSRCSVALQDLTPFPCAQREGERHHRREHRALPALERPEPTGKDEARGEQHGHGRLASAEEGALRLVEAVEVERDCIDAIVSDEDAVIAERLVTGAGRIEGAFGREEDGER